MIITSYWEKVKVEGESRFSQNDRLGEGNMNVITKVTNKFHKITLDFKNVEINLKNVFVRWEEII